MFNTNDNVYCPVCTPRFSISKPEMRVGVVMECIVSNYSGCSVDIAECPECKGQFQVSYKVDSIIPV